MKKFIEFLERNNAWENFERNFIEQGTDVKNYKRNCKALEDSEISYAFTWDKTVLEESERFMERKKQNT